jgi:hypothetical protein
MAQQYSMEIERYLTALKGMYSDVRNWIEGASISVQETTLEIAEEHRGKYDAPSLRLIDAAGGYIVILLSGIQTRLLRMNENTRFPSMRLPPCSPIQWPSPFRILIIQLMKTASSLLVFQDWNGSWSSRTLLAGRGPG